MSTVKDVLKTLDRDGFYPALRTLGKVEGIDRQMRLLAVAYARRVQHLMTDPESVNALDVAEQYANDQATDEDLKKARDTVLDVAANTWDAAIYASATAAAASVAEATATVAAALVADATAAAYAYAAAWAAEGAVVVEDDAAFRAERDWQEAELRRVCECIEAGTDPYPREKA